VSGEYITVNEYKNSEQDYLDKITINNNGKLIEILRPKDDRNEQKVFLKLKLPNSGNTIIEVLALWPEVRYDNKTYGLFYTPYDINFDNSQIKERHFLHLTTGIGNNPETYNEDVVKSIENYYPS
jgi:hypothetical protein